MTYRLRDTDRAGIGALTSSAITALSLLAALPGDCEHAAHLRAYGVRCAEALGVPVGRVHRDSFGPLTPSRLRALVLSAGHALARVRDADAIEGRALVAVSAWGAGRELLRGAEAAPVGFGFGEEE